MPELGRDFGKGTDMRKTLFVVFGIHLVSQWGGMFNGIENFAS